MTTVQQLHEHPIEREMVRLSNASLSMSFSTWKSLEEWGRHYITSTWDDPDWHVFLWTTGNGKQRECCQGSVFMWASKDMSNWEKEDLYAGGHLRIAVSVMRQRVLSGTRVDTKNSWSAVVAVRGMSNIQHTTKVVLRFWFWMSLILINGAAVGWIEFAGAVG